MLCVDRNTRNTAICVGKYIYIYVCVCVCVCVCVYPPKDGGGLREFNHNWTNCYFTIAGKMTNSFKYKAR